MDIHICLYVTMQMDILDKNCRLHPAAAPYVYPKVIYTVF